MAALLQPGRDLRDDRLVLGVAGADEEVVGRVDPPRDLLEPLGVALGQLARRDPLALGGLGDRLAVLVGAGQEEDLVAALAHVPREHVGGDRRIHVAEVGLTVDVVDRCGDVVRHERRCYCAGRSRAERRADQRARRRVAQPARDGAVSGRAPAHGPLATAEAVCADGLGRRPDAHRAADGDRHGPWRLAHGRRAAAGSRAGRGSGACRRRGRRSGGGAPRSSGGRWCPTAPIRSPGPTTWPARTAAVDRCRYEMSNRPSAVRTETVSAGRADKAREADTAGDSRRHRRPDRRGDVDPAVLACRIRPARIGEASEDIAAHRPPPRLRRQPEPRPTPSDARDAPSPAAADGCRVAPGLRSIVSDDAATVDRRRSAVGPPSLRCFARARAVVARCAACYSVSAE